MATELQELLDGIDESVRYAADRVRHERGGRINGYLHRITKIGNEHVDVAYADSSIPASERLKAARRLYVRARRLAEVAAAEVDKRERAREARSEPRQPDFDRFRATVVDDTTNADVTPEMPTSAPGKGYVKSVQDSDEAMVERTRVAGRLFQRTRSEELVDGAEGSAPDINTGATGTSQLTEGDVMDIDTPEINCPSIRERLAAVGSSIRERRASFHEGRARRAEANERRAALASSMASADVPDMDTVKMPDENGPDIPQLVEGMDDSYGGGGEAAQGGASLVEELDPSAVDMDDDGIGDVDPSAVDADVNTDVDLSAFEGTGTEPGMVDSDSDQGIEDIDPSAVDADVDMDVDPSVVTGVGMDTDPSTLTTTDDSDGGADTYINPSAFTGVDTATDDGTNPQVPMDADSDVSTDAEPDAPATIPREVAFTPRAVITAPRVTALPIIDAPSRLDLSEVTRPRAAVVPIQLPPLRPPPSLDLNNLSDDDPDAQQAMAKIGQAVDQYRMAKATNPDLRPPDHTPSRAVERKGLRQWAQNVGSYSARGGRGLRERVAFPRRR